MARAEAELESLWELAEPGDEYVLPTIRLTTNVGPTIDRIIKRAGLGKIQKPAQNMRATRATELEKEFGSHRATEWCGHSEKVAAEAYWMMTGDDIAEASRWCTSGALLVQYRMVDGGNGQQSPSPANEKSPEKPGFTEPCSDLQMASLGPEGLEPPTNEL